MAGLFVVAGLGEDEHLLFHGRGRLAQAFDIDSPGFAFLQCCSQLFPKVLVLLCFAAAVVQFAEAGEDVVRGQGGFRSGIHIAFHQARHGRLQFVLEAGDLGMGAAKLLCQVKRERHIDRACRGRTFTQAQRQLPLLGATFDQRCRMRGAVGCRDQQATLRIAMMESQEFLVVGVPRVEDGLDAEVGIARGHGLGQLLLRRLADEDEVKPRLEFEPEIQ